MTHESLMTTMTTDEFCHLMHISARTARRWLRDRKVIAFRVGRRWLVPVAAVEALLHAQAAR